MLSPAFLALDGAFATNILCDLRHTEIRNCVRGGAAANIMVNYSRVCLMFYCVFLSTDYTGCWPLPDSGCYSSKIADVPTENVLYIRKLKLAKNPIKPGKLNRNESRLCSIKDS